MKKTLLLFVVMVVSGVFLAGCFGGKSTASDKCVPAFYESAPNSRVEAGLVKEGESNIFLTQKVYKMEDMENLLFGFNVNESEEGIYIVYQLCYEDEDLPKELLDLIEDETNYYKNTTKEDLGYYGNSFGGNVTSFMYEVGDGEESYVEKPGNYAVYVLASKGDDDWTIADTFKFTVKE